MSIATGEMCARGGIPITTFEAKDLVKEIDELRAANAELTKDLNEVDEDSRRSIHNLEARVRRYKEVLEQIKELDRDPLRHYTLNAAECPICMADRALAEPKADHLIKNQDCESSMAGWPEYGVSQTLRRRYQNDAIFNHTVNSLERLMSTYKMSPYDLECALVVAQGKMRQQKDSEGA